MFVTHVKKTEKEIVPNYSIYSSLFILHNSFAFIYPDVFVLFYYCGFFLFIYILQFILDICYSDFLYFITFITQPLIFIRITKIRNILFALFPPFFHFSHN